MYGILSDFIYWLNSNILSFSDGVTIPHTILHTFLWDFKFLIFCSKRMKTIQAIKILLMFWNYSV